MIIAILQAEILRWVFLLFFLFTFLFSLYHFFDEKMQPKKKKKKKLKMLNVFKWLKCFQKYICAIIYLRKVITYLRKIIIYLRKVITYLRKIIKYVRKNYISVNNKKFCFTRLKLSILMMDLSLDSSNALKCRSNKRETYLSSDHILFPLKLWWSGHRYLLEWGRSLMCFFSATISDRRF